MLPDTKVPAPPPYQPQPAQPVQPPPQPMPTNQNYGGYPNNYGNGPYTTTVVTQPTVIIHSRSFALGRYPTNVTW